MKSTMITINGEKFDLGNFHHPGSKSIINKLIGTDASSVFNSRHGKDTNVLKVLERYKAMHGNNKGDMNAHTMAELEILALDGSYFIREADYYNDFTSQMCHYAKVASCNASFKKKVEENSKEFQNILTDVENGQISEEELENLHADIGYIAINYLDRLNSKGNSSTANKIIPKPLSTLWIKVSEKLNRKPIIEYADLINYNTVLLPIENHVLSTPETETSSTKEEEKSFHRVEVLRDFTNLPDEKNFYKRHILAEIMLWYKFYPLISQFKSKVKTQDVIDMKNLLSQMSGILEEIKKVSFDNFTTEIDAYIFFNRLRLLFASFEDVEYEGYGKLSFTGATGAQSALFSILDALIELAEATEPLKGILEDFNDHKPIIHRIAIETIRKFYSIRSECIGIADGCFDQEDKVELLNEYNRFVQKYMEIRKAHEKLIEEFVIAFLPEEMKKGASGTGNSPVDIMIARGLQVIAQKITRTDIGVDPNRSENENNESNEPVEVNPWLVKGKIDYDKLKNQFGCQEITEELANELLTIIKKRSKGKMNELHPLLRRGVFYTHRDLEKLLEHLKDEKKQLYIYTGRGPSGGMHLGHLLPFLFTKWLQDAFDCQVVIQMTDDEKYSYRNMSVEEVNNALIENVKDIIAVGFNPDKTFIFSNFQYVGTMYPLINSISRAVSGNKIKSLFGFSLDMNVAMFHFPCIQAAPSFSKAFPHLFAENEDLLCLIPQAIDQDVYFRMTRDIAPVLSLPKPVLIHSKFFPALQGPNSKMSSSDPNSAIFLTDTADEIAFKIRKHAFSGGRSTRKEQEKYGANIHIDVAYQLLLHFEHDDLVVNDVAEKYSSGKLLTASVKDMAIKLVQHIISNHQQRRASVSEDLVKHYMNFPAGTLCKAI